MSGLATEWSRHGGSHVGQKHAWEKIVLNFYFSWTVSSNKYENWPTCQPPWWLQNTVCRYRSSLFRVQWASRTVSCYAIWVDRCTEHIPKIDGICVSWPAVINVVGLLGWYNLSYDLQGTPWAFKGSFRQASWRGIEKITRGGTCEVFVHIFSKPSPDPLLGQNPCSHYKGSQLNKDLIYEMRCRLSKMAISWKPFDRFSFYEDWLKRKGKW